MRLRLPARLRWSAPLGARSEVTETIDISRGGLLLEATQEHAPGTRVWVAFPFDQTQPENQPEIAARVVRSGNGAGPRTVALELLETQPKTNGSSRAERRKDHRCEIAVPVWVRPPYAPWPEEAMTVDASASGLRFVTSREYLVGEQLLVRFGTVAPAGWTSDREESVRVTTILGTGHGVLLETAVRRERQPH